MRGCWASWRSWSDQHLIIPLIGGGRTRLQPVRVTDVAEAVYQALRKLDAVGKTYELAGPETYTTQWDPRPGSCPQGAFLSFHFYPVCTRFSTLVGSRALPGRTIEREALNRRRLAGARATMQGVSPWGWALIRAQHVTRFPDIRVARIGRTTVG
jgi:hypothetical protein